MVRVGISFRLALTAQHVTKLPTHSHCTTLIIQSSYGNSNYYEPSMLKWYEQGRP